MALVLVIDDYEDTRAVVQKLLERRGLQTLGTDTGEAAIALLVTEKPNVIIVDGMMPGMNGIEFIRIVRANVETASIPIILYTAISDQTFLDNAIEKGANEICVKGSHDIGKILECVDRYV